jgi:hypothetical protein
MNTALTLQVIADSKLRYILRSIHLTNMSEDLAHISGNFVFEGNTVPILSKIPMPYGSSFEVLRREQAFKPGDYIEIQGFDKNGIPTSNLISAILTHEPLDEREGLMGTGITMSQSNIDYAGWDSNRFYSIIESIKLVNLDSNIIRSKVSIADANSNILSYLAYNLALPPKTTVEVLQAAKRLPLGNKILTSINNDGNVSVIFSLRKGAEVYSTEIPFEVDAGANVILSFNTLNLSSGSTLYYTIE